jgi:hypothetical protein
MIESTHYTDNFFAEQLAGMNSARKVLPILNDIFHPSSVIDVGCGVGSWLKIWHEEVGVKDIQGVEGPYLSPDLLQIDKKHVLFQDLKAPLQINRKYDLAMSLEVAEHLPSSHAKQFVQTITSLSDVVLFSAAIPGQEGTYHINEQAPEYWADIFRAQGYDAIDLIRPKIWGNPQVEWWYQQNILLYLKSSRVAEFPALADALRATVPNYLLRIHPVLYDRKLQHVQKTKTVSSFINWKLDSLKKKIFKSK